MVDTRHKLVGVNFATNIGFKDRVHVRIVISTLDPAAGDSLPDNLAPTLHFLGADFALWHDPLDNGHDVFALILSNNNSTNPHQMHLQI